MSEKYIIDNRGVWSFFMHHINSGALLGITNAEQVLEIIRQIFDAMDSNIYTTMKYLVSGGINFDLLTPSPINTIHDQENKHLVMESINSHAGAAALMYHKEIEKLNLFMPYQPINAEASIYRNFPFALVDLNPNFAVLIRDTVASKGMAVINNSNNPFITSKLFQPLKPNLF